MSVGSGRFVENRSVFFKPHNYRVYYDFDKSGFNPDFIKPGSVGSVGVGYKLINHGKEFSFGSFMGCRVVVKKQTIEVNNRIGIEQLHVIDLLSDVQEQFEKIIVEKDAQCLRVLRAFIERFGGSSDERVVNVHSENKIVGEDAVNRIPLKMKFHTGSVKKVYNESNVEFSSPAEAANYLENRALERFSPLIAGELESLREELMRRPVESVSLLESIKGDIRRFPVDVIDCSERIKSLCDDDKRAFSDWLFERFGVCV